MRLLEIKAAHAFYICEERNQLELDANPIAPLPLAQHKLPALHRDFCDRLQRVNRNGEWFLSCGRAFSKRIVGANQIGRDARVLDQHGDNLPAFDRPGNGRGIIGVKRKCAVSSPQVGSAHAREGFSLGWDRWKIRGNPEDCIWDAVLIKQLPERYAFSQLFGAATAERNRPTAEADRALRPLDPRGRKKKSQGLRVAMNEIEDSMTTCIHPRNKVGPCYRTLWRNAGCELAKISLSLQFREVRHLPFAHEPMQELGIHTVDAENDQAQIAMPLGWGRTARRQHRHCD